MKKYCFIFALIVYMFCVFSECGYAYWVWSPKTKKWINPVYRTFDNPQEQLDWAKGYYEDGEYRKAIFEFKKVLARFPKTEYAPEAKYHIALCEEKLGKFWRAFKTYESIIKFYPLNERLDAIVERQYLIGEKYFSKKKYELAKRIFEKVINNSPYSKVSDVAQYKLGICYLRMRDYNNARDEFQKIHDDYSFSPYLDQAVYEIAFCSFKVSSLVKDYDVRLIDKAADDLQYFLRRFPTNKYVPQAESLLNKLVHLRAKKIYEAGQFYEKQKKIYAAVRYYEEVLYSYEATPWGQRAREKLKKLRK
ncbi:MAG: outer membrane protein assembly factor BamD [Candidatus Omnitrophica bacterium]|nr:outer membrane protein assembly factor BamD [Candidatus Omnitrophota bacterium]MBU1925495.1 outer membrane protein assembly factor BamD [Candidatus Omnitrophota bacterium]MBU2062953.1 outer membrane protein assembly factor BamD [Candidatus Omnitrophota bacterium]